MKLKFILKISISSMVYNIFVGIHYCFLKINRKYTLLLDTPKKYIDFQHMLSWVIIISNYIDVPSQLPLLHTYNLSSQMKGQSEFFDWENVSHKKKFLPLFF